MSLTRAFNKAVNKATYDPELEKQLAEEKKQAREARTKLRESLTTASNKNRELSARNEITPQATTLAASVVQETQKWLQDTPDATADEIQDKIFEVVDKLATIYTDDKNRLFFVNSLKTWDVILTQWQTQNKISEDKAKRIKKILTDEQAWYEKNLNESLQTYTARLEEMNESIKQVVADPTLVQESNEEKNKQVDKDSAEIDALKAKAEADKKAKEELEKQQFSLGRLLKKVYRGVGGAFIVALILAVCFTGASLAANEAIARPVPYRILFFIFGFIFSVPVIFYYIGRTFLFGQSPYFASYLLPLYPYDPTREEHESFLENLVWYKENAVIRDAIERFQSKADLVKSLKITIPG